MRLMAGFLVGMLAASFTTLHLREKTRLAARTDLLHLFLTALVWSAALLMLSFVLPDDWAELAQTIVAWALGGTVAAVAALATVRGLERSLDS